MKLKQMPSYEFEEVLSREGNPVRLVGGAIPRWAQNIPHEILAYVFASGTQTVPPTTAYRSPRIPSGELIGGIDVYRMAPDDPVEFNKDWYAVLRCNGDSSVLSVDGPFKDEEHWLDDVPERLQGLEVLGVPKPRQDEVL